MRLCSKISASLITLVLIIITAVSCNKEFDFGFKELCFYHPHTAPVKVNVDWGRFRHIEQPTGMTVHVWPQHEDGLMHRFVSHNLDNIMFDMEAGAFHAFVFNQSESEYATIEFKNLDDFDRAEVAVKEVKSSWYSTKLPETRVGSEPEWLAVDCIRDVEVTEEMVRIAEEEFLAGLKESEKTRTRGATKSVNELGTLTPRSVIRSVDIYVHIENVPFLRSARGAIKDMAKGCNLSTLTTTSESIDHTLESWTLMYEKDENGAEDLTRGVLKTTLSTFGLPSGHTGAPTDNRLYFNVLLVDNVTTLEFDFPIGDHLADLNGFDGSDVDENGKAMWPEVHVYLPEPLPEVEPVGGSDGAFDVGVGDWGDEIITILPLL